MTIQDQPPRESFGDRLGSFVVRAFRLLLRLLVVALLGIGLGAGAYLGLPALYRSYVEPVQLNAQRIQELEKAFAEAQATGLEKDTANAKRLADLEGEVVRLEEALQEQGAKVESLAATVEKQRKQLEGFNREWGRVDDLESETEAITSRLSKLEETLAGEDAPTQQLARRFQLLRALELLTRARLWLTQNNLGLAAKDLTSALTDLQEVQETAPEDEAAVLALISERIELALGDLNTAPVIAADDIEVAWRMLYEATGQ